MVRTVSSDDQICLINHLFPVNSEDSKVDVVRIACNHTEVVNILPSINRLSNLGYRVVINLMQVFSLTKYIIKDVISIINASKAEVLYFVDS